MFQRSTQASCRLSARRRLALGGLVVTGALAAGAFVSAPAYADGSTLVANSTDLQNALAAHASSIQLTQSISSFDFEEVAVPTTLDLHGFDLSTGAFGVDANASLSVIDSTATTDAGSNSHLTVSPAPSMPESAVGLAAGSTFHVTDINVNVTGADGGAGIGGSEPSASFIADGTATVAAAGSDDGTHGGAAGIGGLAGQPGIHVTIDGGATVSAHGGAGAAGVGGGYGGAGGDVHIANGSLQAMPGVLQANDSSPASAIGGGESDTASPAFGSLTLDAKGTLDLAESTPLRIPAGATVENGGTIELTDENATGAKQIFGAGTIHNLGTIDARVDDANGNGTTVDPSSLIAPTVAVTGYNFALGVDANGGTISGAPAAPVHHVMSGSLTELLGTQYSVDAPSGATQFSGWNTSRDGSGTAVQDGVAGDLSGLGLSNGTAVSVTLYAQFKQPLTAPVLAMVEHHTVKLGRSLSFQLSANGTKPVTYAVTAGALPKGFTLDRSTGRISGRATEAGLFDATVTATNSVGSDWAEVMIFVPEPHALLSTKNHVPAVEVGAAKVPLKVEGLRKGEHWTIRVDGRVVEHGTMKHGGALSVSVHLKKARRDAVHTITIAGSRKVTDPALRDATTVTVTSLAAKKTLKVSSLAGYDGEKYVVVEGLAAGEHVVVKEGAKVIVSGDALSDGSFVFPQAKAGKGTSKLTVHGASEKRSGKLTVKNPTH